MLRRQNTLQARDSTDRAGSSNHHGSSDYHHHHASLNSARGGAGGGGGGAGMRSTSNPNYNSSSMGSPNDLRGPLADLQQRLANTQTESLAITALAFIHGKASNKDSRITVAQMFTDPSIPDLIFGICRRYPACISFVSSIMILCSEIPDFAKKSLRNRTIVAFLRFLTSNESLANAFELLVTGSVHALKSFSASEGEKVITDVMGQLKGKARSHTIVSLMRIVARLITEPPNSTQERTNLLSAFLLLVADSDTLNFLSDGCKNDALSSFLDGFVSILKAAGQIDTLIIPVEVICIIGHLLIDDGCGKGEAEGTDGRNGGAAASPRQQQQQHHATGEAKIAEWDTIAARLIQTMTAFPSTDGRRQSVFVGQLWATAAAHSKALSPSLVTALLQCAILWMQKGWMVPAVIDVVNASFAHPLANTAEHRNAVVVLLHSFAFKSVHPSLLQLNIPAIRPIFSRFVMEVDAPAVATPSNSTSIAINNDHLPPDERTLCEFWICFVHMATYLRLAHVQELFLPLGEHIRYGRVKERTFQEMTRWPRNDANDERKLMQCRNELAYLRTIEDAESEHRKAFDVVFEDIRNFYFEFKTTLTELEKDPRFVQKFSEWQLAVNDDRQLFIQKTNVIDSAKSELMQFLQTRASDITRTFKEATAAEKNSHTSEVDGIVWDADEMATKVLAHTNRLAQIENAFDKDSREVQNMSQWRFGICDQILASLQTMESKRSLRILNLEKEEERLRGSAVVSSQQFASIRHDHDAERESLIQQEMTERRALWLTPSASVIEQYRISREKIFDFEQLHMEQTIDIEEEKGREYLFLSRAFFMERPDLPSIAKQYALRTTPSRSPVGRNISPRGNMSPTNSALNSTLLASNSSNGGLNNNNNNNNNSSGGGGGGSGVASGVSGKRGSGGRATSPMGSGSNILTHNNGFSSSNNMNGSGRSRSHSGGANSSPSPQRSPTLTPRTHQTLVSMEAQSRQQYASREMDWRRYYIEACDVERRKVWYQIRYDETQRFQLDMAEGIARIRLMREWSAAMASLQQYAVSLHHQSAAVGVIGGNGASPTVGTPAAVAAMAGGNNATSPSAAAATGGVVGGLNVSGVGGPPRSFLDRSMAAADPKQTAAGGAVVATGSMHLANPPSLYSNQGGNLPAVLHTSNVYSSGIFNQNNNSSSPATTAATSQEIAQMRELKSVLGYIPKAVIKYRTTDVIEMEMHRRSRIINLYKIFMNEIYSQMTLIQFKTRIQWPLADEEMYVRYNEACIEQAHFNRLLEYKVYEERYTLPLRHIHEIERQVRSQIQIDEKIALQQFQIHRPRGKRYRPLREVESDHPRSSAEPGLASRVKGWLREGKNSAQNPIPCFTEVSSSIVHILSTELHLPKPIPPAAMNNKDKEKQLGGGALTSHSLNSAAGGGGLGLDGGSGYNADGSATNGATASLAGGAASTASGALSGGISGGVNPSTHYNNNNMKDNENSTHLYPTIPSLSSGSPSGILMRPSPEPSKNGGGGGGGNISTAAELNGGGGAGGGMMSNNISLQGNLTHVNSAAGLSYGGAGAAMGVMGGDGGSNAPLIGVMSPSPSGAATIGGGGISIGGMGAQMGGSGSLGGANASSGNVVSSGGGGGVGVGIHHVPSIIGIGGIGGAGASITSTALHPQHLSPAGSIGMGGHMSAVATPTSNTAGNHNLSPFIAAAGGGGGGADGAYNASASPLSASPSAAPSAGHHLLPMSPGGGGHFASRLRGEVKVERNSTLLLTVFQKLETARREDVARVEATARATFGYQSAKVVAHRYAIKATLEDKETATGKYLYKKKKPSTKN